MGISRLIVIVALALSVLLLCGASPRSIPEDREPVRIGVLAKRGAWRCLEKWGPTAEYLSAEIPGFRFTIKPLNFEEVYLAAERKEVDFVLANPSLYVGLEQFHNAGRIATLRNLCLGEACTGFAGVIFHRADRKDIEHLGDLEGKTFMAVNEASFGGWQVAWRELKERGIDPHRDFADLRFAGTHDAVVYAVRDGKVDAGTVRTSTLERMAMEGKISLDGFRVIHAHGGEEVHLPFLHSTRTYPEWPLAKLADTSDELAEKVAVALIRLFPDSPAAKAARCAGWTVPHNYRPVRECLQELRAGPYEGYGKITLSRVVRHYWPWLVGVVLLLTVAGVVAAYVTRLNRSLRLALWEQNQELAERQRAEEALRSERNKLQALFDGLDDTGIGINIIGVDYRIIFQNHVLQRQFGDAIGRLCYEVYMGLEEACALCPMTQAIKCKVTEQIEIAAADGRHYEVLAAPLRDADGTVDKAIEVVTDITDRKRMEETLRESEQKYRTLFESSAEGVILMTDVFVDCNEQACRLFGCKREDIVGHSPVEFSPPEQPDGRSSSEESRKRNEAAFAGTPQFFEWQHQRKDGSLLDTEISLNGVTVDGKQFLQATVHDITDRKQAEQAAEEQAAALKQFNEELKKANTAAQAATRAKSEFLANMSHEIRTPLTAILGFADVLSGKTDDPESIEAVKTIKRNGDYLLGVINGILDLSKIESGKLEVERISCLPQRTVTEVAALMKIRADGKGLHLSVEFDGPIPETISTDPTRLRQILINLVGNAVKFTEIGSIRIVVRLVDTDGKEPKLQFDVIDTGIGMKQEQLDGLFDSFTQADASTTRKFGGTGLGLAISKRLAGMLGGRIMATSVPEKGSTFSLTVATGPLDGVRMLEHTGEAVPRHEQPVPQASSPKLRSGCRILLVEDGPDNQRLISVVLKRAGAEVVIAENGKEALKKALSARPGWGRRRDDETKPFDIILMDIQMPVMGGHEATRRLRQEGYTNPIIALSAHAMTHAVKESLDAGCDDFMAKPIDRKKLITLIAEYLEKSPRSAETVADDACP